jgi:hypothetical protein
MAEVLYCPGAFCQCRRPVLRGEDGQARCGYCKRRVVTPRVVEVAVAEVASTAPTAHEDARFALIGEGLQAIERRLLVLEAGMREVEDRQAAVGRLAAPRPPTRTPSPPLKAGPAPKAAKKRSPAPPPKAPVKRGKPGRGR